MVAAFGTGSGVADLEVLFDIFSHLRPVVVPGQELESLSFSWVSGGVGVVVLLE